VTARKLQCRCATESTGIATAAAPEGGEVFAMTDVEVPSAEQPARTRGQPSRKKSPNASAYNVLGSLINTLPDPPMVRFSGITILALTLVLIALSAGGLAHTAPAQWSWSFAAIFFFLIGALVAIFFTSIVYQVIVIQKTPVVLDTETMREELIMFTTKLEMLENETKKTIEDFRRRLRSELARRLEDAALQEANRKSWEKREAEIREKIRQKVEDALADVREILAKVGNIGLDEDQEGELQKSLQALQKELTAVERELLTKLQMVFRFMDLSKARFIDLSKEGGLLSRWCEGEAVSTSTKLKSLYKILVKLPVREELVH
jgi:hypothetical protein